MSGQGKHSGENIVIDGIEFTLRGLTMDGHFVGYFLQSADDFPPSPTEDES